MKIKIFWLFFLCVWILFIIYRCIPHYASKTYHQVFNIKGEPSCHTVSSRGILKSCEMHPMYPVSSVDAVDKFNIPLTPEVKVIYVQGSALIHFIVYTLPKISHKFTLVTGDCDEAIPRDVMSSKEFNIFVRDTRLVHWYSQNLAISHPKMTAIPIGLDYHTFDRSIIGTGMRPMHQEQMLSDIKNQAPPLHQRAILCYANFHFQMTKDRKKAMEQIPTNLVYYEKHRTSRKDAWKTQSFMTFVVSPYGNGYDCHRTWEALVLGSIPIIRSSPIDNVYEGLPVLIVKDWRNVTLPLLQKTAKSFSKPNRVWKWHKLQLQYWMSLINNSTFRI